MLYSLNRIIIGFHSFYSFYIYKNVDEKYKIFLFAHFIREVMQSTVGEKCQIYLTAEKGLVSELPSDIFCTEKQLVVSQRNV